MQLKIIRVIDELGFLCNMQVFMNVVKVNEEDAREVQREINRIQSRGCGIDSLIIKEM